MLSIAIFTGIGAVVGLIVFSIVRDIIRLILKAGDYRDMALAKSKTVGRSTEAYKSYSIGKLPAGHLDARARRYAVKLFLAHYHHVAYELEYGTPPPKPYILDGDRGHTHYIAPPKWPMEG